MASHNKSFKLYTSKYWQLPLPNKTIHKTHCFHGFFFIWKAIRSIRNSKTEELQHSRTTMTTIKYHQYLTKKKTRLLVQRREVGNNTAAAVAAAAANRNWGLGDSTSRLALRFLYPSSITTHDIYNQTRVLSVLK